MSWLWAGGRFAPCGALPVEDRGFRYGMSFFETAGVRRGEPVLLEAHLDLLRAACNEAGWRLPDAFPDAFRALPDLLRGLPFRDGVARLYITAGDGGPCDPVTAPRLLVLGQAGGGEPARKPRLITLPPASVETPWPGRKTGNYWAPVEALRAARLAGGEEAVRVDLSGEAVSAAMANLFFLVGGELITPPHAAARRGVVRGWLLALGKIGGVPVREGAVRAAERAGAEEVLLTNSRIGVLPAASLDGRTLAPGGVGESLARLFDERFPPG